MAVPNDALEQLPPPHCPYLDAELDDAVTFDVADFHELRLLSALSGEPEALRFQVAEL
ncbi:hypothetical protein [Myxococcus llanfairpwllgwyngyllgogerychwyrndrobwllllantysiliogogogochensis]|uniref:hypothetical protein n=1 Tax=Myxococcus llanfairpwllgwyngyllgogerychwyrndrobwllllantysiliogogogochensis TaxID=2590453 RepID=UPI0015F0984A|nr:hypothetical protein [Myxococcus llanfairpwllgwyngyllgogerychwyrndrobwllllantysiliogogogochensis]